MLKNKRQRNQKGYGKIKSTEEWLEKEHKKQWKTNGKRKQKKIQKYSKRTWKNNKILFPWLSQLAFFKKHILTK